MPRRAVGGPWRAPLRSVRGICGWSGRLGSRSADPVRELESMAAPFRVEGAPGATRISATSAVACSSGEVVESGGWSVVAAGDPRTENGLSAWLERFSVEGTDAWSEIRGHFAIAVTDPGGGLFLAVDRAGVCPLWYQPTDGGLLFGTDPRCLDRHPVGRTEVDPQSLYHYVYFAVVPSPGSIRKGRRRLMPGEHVRFDGERSRVGRYWSLGFDESGSATEAERRSQLFDALRGSVPADVEESGRVGAFLSGVLDSSTLVGLLAERA